MISTKPIRSLITDEKEDTDSTAISFISKSNLSQFFIQCIKSDIDTLIHRTLKKVQNLDNFYKLSKCL